MKSFYMPNEILNIIFSFIPITETSKLLKNNIYIHNNSTEEPFYTYILRQNKMDKYYLRREKRKQETYKKINLLQKTLDWGFINSRISFGKFKGTYFVSIPDDYVIWIIKNNVLKLENQTNALKGLRTLRELNEDIYFLSKDMYN